MPCKPCNYLALLLSPAVAFYTDMSTLNTSKQHWLVLVFNIVTEQYFVHVSEVLASVQKMEESLRRLKRVRDTRSATGGKEEVSNKVSDDDKIRLQLYLDVSHYLGRISEEFGLDLVEVSKAKELDEIVSDATKNYEDVRVRYCLLYTSPSPRDRG